jgi:hypothetical protein
MALSVVSENTPPDDRSWHEGCETSRRDLCGGDDKWRDSEGRRSRQPARVKSRGNAKFVSVVRKPKDLATLPPRPLPHRIAPQSRWPVH